MTAQAAAAAPPARPSWSPPLFLRLAVRELRSGLSGFTIFVACIALGVTAIAGIGSLAAALQQGLDRQGREILGGDMTLELVHRQADEAERRFLAGQGDVARMALLRAMSRVPGGGPAAMVQVKAVDAAYPLYGAVTLAGAKGAPVPVAALRESGAIAVDPILLARLGVAVGDTLRLGDGEVRIVASVASEPDRLAGRLEFGPRALMSVATLETTGLIQPGSLVNWRYLLKLDPAAGRGIAEARRAVDERLAAAGYTIRDRRDPSPRLRRAIDRFADFFTLVGVATLLIGGVGVASAISTYLARKRETIAAFKCLGATGGTVFAIYLAQVVILAGVGVGIGLVLGAALPALVVGIYGAVIPIELAVQPQPQALALAALYGMATALLFVLWPLGLARELKPALLLRQNVESERRWPRRVYVVASAVLALGLGALTIAAAERKLLSLYSLAGVAAILAVYFGLGLLIERAARRLPRSRVPELALGLASLAGPGALVRSVVLSLGASLSLLTGLALVNTSLTAELQERLPENAPSYYVLDVAQDQREPLVELIRGLVPEVRIDAAPMLRGRIVRVAGTPADRIKPSDEAAWVLNGDRGLTYSATLPEGSTLSAGEWWPEDYAGPPLVSFEGEIAEGIGLKIGETVTVNVLGRNVEARVANLRKVDWDSLAINFVMVFSPKALAGAPFNLLATVTLPRDLPPEREGQMIQALADAFPTVTAIRVRDALDTFQNILDRVMVAIRAAGGFTLFTGAVVLAGALATSQRRRIREAVIFKTLGATRRRIVAAHLIEYAVLALVTGVAAVGLGTLGAYLALTFAMDSKLVFSALAVAQAIGLAVFLVLLFGAVGTWRALSARPAQQLRAG